MKQNTQSPTRLTANAHEGQSAANTNKIRILRTHDEFMHAIRESLKKPSPYSKREHGRFPKPPTCTHSRKQSLADGLEVQVPQEIMEKMNDDWDFLFDSPLFLTKKAVETCESASGRSLYSDLGPLWEILCVLDNALDCPLLGWGSPMVSRIPFKVSFGTSERAPCLWLNINWSTFDIHDPRPSFTVMLPEED